MPCHVLKGPCTAARAREARAGAAVSGRARLHPSCCGGAESARTWKGSSMYGSLTTEAKSACSAASRPAFTAVTISMGRRSRAARAGAMAGGSLGGTPLDGVCPAAAPGRGIGEQGFHRRSRAQRRSPIIVCGRLLELRR
eukprot:scaffold1627_cov58-Phaeocystis_antarctica.AAC.4